MKLDILVGLQYGDEGKGKVSYDLLKKNTNYTHCMRFNGGGNAGHTIYVNKKKLVTHQIPAGVLVDKPSIIGSGCVINPKKLFEEINMLEENGINVSKNLKIAHNAHIVTPENIAEEESEIANNIGTTKQGIGTTYSKKCLRTNKRAQDEKNFKKFIINSYDYFKNQKDPYIFLEGAQGFALDIDHGNYPFVTSSPCTTASALQNGFSYKHINKVWGSAKCYETYVGNYTFQTQENSDIFNKIQKEGKEYGATTNRPRQVNFLDEYLLEKAIKINGVNELVINKMDILENVNAWFIKNSQTNEIKNLENKDKFCEYLNNLCQKIDPIINIHFSYNKNHI